MRRMAISNEEQNVVANLRKQFRNVLILSYVLKKLVTKRTLTADIMEQF